MAKNIKIKRIFDLLQRGGFNVNPIFDSQGNPLKLDQKVVGAISEAILGFLNNLPEDDFIASSQGGTHPVDDTELRTSDYPLKQTEDLPEVAGNGAVLWNKIDQLPGYQQSGIRKMGRDIFLSFPCFQEFSRISVEHGRDPLGNVFVVSDLTHNQSAVNYLAEMIRRAGTEVQHGVMGHAPFIPGYAPRIAVFMTEDHTFKLVMDRPEYGAHISLNSIYAWPGGLKAYRKMALEMAEPQLAIGQLASVK